MFRCSIRICLLKLAKTQIVFYGINVMITVVDRFELLFFLKL